MRFGALLVICCACGRLGFEARQGETIDGGPTDGLASDATVPTDSASGACTQPTGGTTFPGGLPCADWGATALVQNAAVNESGSALVVSPSPDTQGAQGGCSKSAVPFGAPGVTVEIANVLAGANTLTAIQLGLGPTALSMVVSNNTLLAEDASGTRGMITYNAQAMRFWRIRPGNPIVFEYGPNGATWTMLATSSQIAQPTYDVILLAGELLAEANPGSATFQSVTHCP